MDEKQLIPISLNQDAHKKELRISIARSKKRLMSLIERVSALSFELELIQQEYNSRIGRLYIRDDMLDYEIIRYKSLKEFMDQGLSYAEALKKLESHFVNQKEIPQEEDENFFSPKENTQLPQEERVHLKKIWKTLLFRLHPDLTIDTVEKKRREHLMKQINKAYAQGDLETLQLIDQEGYQEKEDVDSLEALERMLITLENSILVQEKKFRELRVSEWFGWKRKKETLMKKKSKKDIDVFAEIEDKLLEDIVRKVDILQKLKKEVNG